MFSRRLALIASFTTLSACSLPSPPAQASIGSPHRTALAAYRSEAELTQALDRWRGEAEKQWAERRRGQAHSPLTAGALALSAQPMSAPAPAPAAAKAADAAAESNGITNLQTAGVDEGGIVKRAGDHLVILRRGRLFTVRVGGDTLQPAAMVDAYAPGSNPQGAWYDELLISGSSVVVIGYSYARGGTEVGLFELGAGGALSYRATYHLRSFDYYSSRNYASRLVGRKLVFYSPTLLQPHGPAPMQLFPAMRRWQPQSTPDDFERILPATRVYRTDDEFDPMQPLALHTVTSCDLGAADLRCESTAVLGPAGRVFYVSAGSVYVWTSGIARREAGRPLPPVQALSSVFRIPLDGSAPTGLKTAGVPTDAFSFLEDSRGHLNVLVREGGSGEGMWGSERGSGRLALLRVPLTAFGDGRGAARREHYQMLPTAGRALQNRYVGDWLVWGAGDTAWALRYAGAAGSTGSAGSVDSTDAAEPSLLSPGHTVERIEALGSNAVLVGNAGADLVFSTLRLAGRGAAVVDRHLQPGMRQGETRSHGFFYRPDGAGEGLLGLPVLSASTSRRPGLDAVARTAGSASVLYLRQRDLAFTPLGELRAEATAVRDDACKASCVDWYGNARPIFLGERVFALMGYELVEGTLAGRGGRERIDERRRVGFAPTGPAADTRHSPFN